MIKGLKNTSFRLIAFKATSRDFVRLVSFLHSEVSANIFSASILRAVFAVTFAIVRLCSSLLLRGSEITIFFHTSGIGARIPL